MILAAEILPNSPGLLMVWWQATDYLQLQHSSIYISHWLSDREWEIDVICDFHMEIQHKHWFFYDTNIYTHWNGNVIILMKSSLQPVPTVVK